ncbi:DUF3618 domain-containing protein [Frankia sp. Cppng1_Ct_nod]|uniref:DUF3618 domain-containing protein n=1 Tax=Frankia sp. Cppng1_Ct_nod TaxID=2897162 RepID=UPI0013EF66C6|nr:DUF3618 domain-containing protein [Frankia sp. Cppng1_Ct_nod]
MGENPDEIKTDIEATRSRLAEEINLLSAKISPGRVAGRTAEDAKHAVAHARERMASGAADAKVRLAGATEDFGPRASATAHKARDTVGHAVTKVGHNPQVAATAHKARDTVGHAVTKVGHNPQVAATAEKAQQARETVGHAVTKVGHNPQVAATTEKVRESAGQTARTVRTRAAANPRATATVAGVAVTAIVVTVALRRRACR